MSKEAFADGRQLVVLSNNGKSCEIPVPFTPLDHVDVSALYPRAMIMVHYAKQLITAHPHGTGEEIIVYQDGKVKS